jgi:transposase
MAKPILDDELWALIEPLLPPPEPRRSRYPGRKPLDDRALLTGILFVLQTGLRWDLLPREMGLRQRHELLAPSAGLAGCRCLGPTA